MPLLSLRSFARRVLPVVVAAAAPIIVASSGVKAEEAAPAPHVLEIDRVWSGHPVGFAWLRHEDLLILAYYDADRRLTVASGRATAEGLAAPWTITHLPSTLVWDSHNGIVLARDDQGRIHLSGNMHVVPLVYFRTSRPDDVTSFEPIHRMTGDRETRCTYPRFFQGPKGELLFSYRDGASGRGDLLINAYDPASQTWRRLIDGPLLDGENERNAYPFGPTPGPDGRFHLGWVWRDTPDCSTNHDLSYARSADLIHWENAAGEPLSTPIRLADPVVVDPVPIRGGLLNANNNIFIDSQKRPILTYHKHDAQGHTQAYTARFEEGAWKIRAASRWDSRWEFSGGGSIQADVHLGALAAAGPGRLALPFNHWIVGEGRLLLDEATLEPTAAEPKPKPSPERPAAPRRPTPDVPKSPEGTAPGLRVQTLRMPGPNGGRLALRWETLGPNRDRPRTGPLPEPSALRLYLFPSVAPR